MKNFIGAAVSTLGLVVYVGGILWGFIECLKIVVEQYGLLGIIIGIGLAPLTAVCVPIYEVLMNSNWFLIILFCGAFIGGTTLVTIGEKNRV